MEQRDAAPSLPMHAFLLIVALATVITAQGGFYAGSQQTLFLVLTLAAAVLAALRAYPWSRREPWLTPLPACCAALAAWALISSTLVGRPSGAVPTIALLLGITTVILVSQRITATERQVLVAALLALGVLAAATGWVGVAWRVEPLAIEDQGIWRAATTLTYANASAALLVPLALLALALFAARPPSLLLGMVTCILLVGITATGSRGGFLAMASGTVVLVRLRGFVPTLRAAALAAAGAAIAIVALIPSVPAALPSRPLLAVIGLLGGLAVVAGASLLSSRVLSITIGMVFILGAVAVANAGVSPVISDSIGAVRLNLVSEDRAMEARAALRLVADRPITGVGPGEATLAWTDSDGRTFVARYVHNEYLQVLAELGIVGLVLLLALLFLGGRVVWHGRSYAPSPEVWSGVTAGLIALAVHSSFDFLWHIPAILLVAAVLIGLVVPQNAKSPKE